MFYFYQRWHDLHDAMKGHIYAGTLALGAWGANFGISMAGVDAMFRLLIDVGSFAMLVLSIIGWFRAWQKTK